MNFSDEKLDNPVKIGKNYCLVETTSASQITCRVSETGTSAPSTSSMIVFLRTSEEAKSDVAQTYLFQAPVRTITGMTNAFDAATNSLVFTVTGTGFPAGNTAGVSMFINDIAQ